MQLSHSIDCDKDWHQVMLASKEIMPAATDISENPIANNCNETILFNNCVLLNNIEQMNKQLHQKQQYI